MKEQTIPVSGMSMYVKELAMLADGTKLWVERYVNPIQTQPMGGLVVEDKQGMFLGESETPSASIGKFPAQRQEFLDTGYMNTELIDVLTGISDEDTNLNKMLSRSRSLSVREGRHADVEHQFVQRRKTQMMPQAWSEQSTIRSEGQLRVMRDHGFAIEYPVNVMTHTDPGRLVSDEKEFDQEHSDGDRKRTPFPVLTGLNIGKNWQNASRQ